MFKSINSKQIIYLFDTFLLSFISYPYNFQTIILIKTVLFFTQYIISQQSFLLNKICYYL